MRRVSSFYRGARHQAADVDGGKPFQSFGLARAQRALARRASCAAADASRQRGWLFEQGAPSCSSGCEHWCTEMPGRMLRLDRRLLLVVGSLIFPCQASVMNTLESTQAAQTGCIDLKVCFEHL